MTTTRAIALARRPVGVPTSDDFTFVDLTVREPRPGEIVVRNAWMSVDPYMRRRMNEGKSYVPAFELDAPLNGGAVGRVTASEDPGYSVGDWVLHDLGWRETSVLKAAHVRAIDVDAVPASAYLGVLGMPGLTAWAGLVEVAGLRSGDTVFVSGAAGAVGSLVGQIAKVRGNTVVGSAGTPEKVRWLTEDLGFDHAFSYRDGDLAAQLAQAAPQGIDVYFDNVGGDHLQAAMACANDRARFAMCGTVAEYNAAEPQPGPSNMFEIVSKRLSLRGFIATDHFGHFPEFLTEIAPAVRSGEIAYRETVREGLDEAPRALVDMLQGDNVGKMLVRLEPNG